MKTIAAPLLAVLMSAGCMFPEETDLSVEQQAALSMNALSMNALSMNALSMNALSMNALSMNALSMNGLLDTAEGVELTTYLARCALPAGTDLVAEVDGITYTFPGSIGLAPEWLDSPLSASDSGWVSACLLAHVNALATPHPISLRGDHEALETDGEERAAFDFEEAAFFGDLFADDAAMVACAGRNSGGAEAMLDAIGRTCGVSVDGVTTTCGFSSAGDCLAACGSVDTKKGFRDCADGTSSFAQVVTVYLSP